MKKKKKKLQYSVVYKFTLVSRRLLARAARALHHHFDDLSTSSELSTKTRRFGYFVACVASVSVRLSFHFLPASRTL